MAVKERTYSGTSKRVHYAEVVALRKGQPIEEVRTTFPIEKKSIHDVVGADLFGVKPTKLAERMMRTNGIYPGIADICEVNLFSREHFARSDGKKLFGSREGSIRYVVHDRQLFLRTEIAGFQPQPIKLRT